MHIVACFCLCVGRQVDDAISQIAGDYHDADLKWRHDEINKLRQNWTTWFVNDLPGAIEYYPVSDGAGNNPISEMTVRET